MRHARIETWEHEGWPVLYQATDTSTGFYQVGPTAQVAWDRLAMVLKEELTPYDEKTRRLLDK